MPYSKNGFDYDENRYPCDDDCARCYYASSCDNYYVPTTNSDDEAEIKREEEKKPEVDSAVQNNSVANSTYEQRVKNFVYNETNKIVDDYYRLGYDKRKLVKYAYNEQFNYGYSRSQKDNFYISGYISTGNLQTRWNNLPVGKRQEIEAFVKKIKLFDAADFLSLFYVDEDGCKFSNSAAAAIDYRVLRDRSSGRWVYSLPEKHISDRTCNKEEVKKEYKKYIDEKHQNEN